MTAEILNETKEEIGAHERFVLGKRTRYMLFMGRDGDCVGYLIGIKREGESVEAFVGEDFLSAVVLFEKIVHGDVLPYSLPEIAEDFQKGEQIYQDKNSQTPLQMPQNML